MSNRGDIGEYDELAEREKRAKLDIEPVLTGDPDIDKILRDCIRILGTKGKDYALGTDDKLHNFKTAADFTGMTPEQALSVYLYKHVSAVFAYLKDGSVKSEPIEGRLADAINYLLLCYKMVKARQRGEL